MTQSAVEIEPQALTFSDVSLVPAHSDVLPRDTQVGTRLSRNIELNIPILSAAMDTVTESALAIALAQEGGMGIIHRNLSIEAQSGQVARVKRSESGMIAEPVTLAPQDRVQRALDLMQQYRISGLPVVDQAGKLVGILTNRDLRFEGEPEKEVAAVMTDRQLITAPVGTSLEKARQILHQHRIEKLPVVDDQGVLKGLITVKDIQKRIQYPHACKDQRGRLRVGAAVGVGDDLGERVAALVGEGVDAIAIDTAHGHSRQVLKATAWCKAHYPDTDLIVGNIATAAAVADLAGEGADAVKVGIGPSAICTTRVISGVGVPQISAVSQCAEAAAQAGITTIADGGIAQSGDITKALAAGASAVMIGYLFAGTDESPGEMLTYQGRTFKVYRGMGSLGAMQQRPDSGERYFQGGVEAAKLVPEGIEGQVPYKGSLAGVVYQLVGGLRAGMGYCGAATIAALQAQARFVQVTGSGVRESHPHDVTITKEAPNYRLE
ncbi:MAG: IMP dehydrogenase [Candidatus Latescibacteria bacterium]|nr:IMP dehydrogenase [Candidatus Latescibacterota bacterium]